MSFKSTVLINEFLCTNDDVDVYNKLRKIAEVKELVNLDEQFPIKLILNENRLNPNDNPVIVDSEDEYEKNDNLFEENSKYKSKQHKSLKLQVCSRWNSALFMTESIEQLYNGVKKLLKKMEKENCV